MYTPTCDSQRTDGSGNLQWPSGSLCTTAPTIADPMLGPARQQRRHDGDAGPASGSPAKGLGTGCPATDQRGNPRSSPCTAGAVEIP